jgi:hypothetical protein
VPFFGDSDEVAEVPQFHCHTRKDMKFVLNIS